MKRALLGNPCRIVWFMVSVLASNCFSVQLVHVHVQRETWTKQVLIEMIAHLQKWTCRAADSNIRYIKEWADGRWKKSVAAPFWIGLRVARWVNFKLYLSKIKNKFRIWTKTKLFKHKVPPWACSSRLWQIYKITHHATWEVEYETQ